MKKENKELVKSFVTMDTQSLIIMGLLMAVEIVLTRLLSFQAWNLRISLGFIPIAIAGMILGPVKAGLMSAVGDILGLFLFPAGSYFPGFTLTALLTGIVFGALLYKSTNKWRIIIAVAIHECVLGLFLNTLWLSILFSTPYWTLFATRILKAFVMVPVGVICLVIVCNKHVRKVLMVNSHN